MEEDDSSINIPRGAMLNAWSENDWENGVQIDKIEDLKTLAVRTHNSLYEVTIISGHSGEVLVRGGKFFAEFTPACLVGSTLGGSIMKMRGIYVGMQMEIHANGKRYVTSPVESIGMVV